jgi:hypothetical protein
VKIAYSARPICVRSYANHSKPDPSVGEWQSSNDLIPREFSLLMLAPLVILGVILGISILSFGGRVANLADILPRMRGPATADSTEVWQGIATTSLIDLRTGLQNGYQHQQDSIRESHRRPHGAAGVFAQQAR